VLINFTGAILGSFVGLVICFAQERYGLIEMTGGAVESYPVTVKMLDVLGIFFTVLAVGTLFSSALVRILVRRFAGNAMMTVGRSS
jgi:lipoprotein-releasing system permease protein